MSERNETASGPPQPPDNAWNQAVPALLAAAVVGLGGLFIQVAKLDQSLTTVVSDISELKNDSKERLTDLERRVRTLERSTGHYSQ